MIIVFILLVIVPIVAKEVDPRDKVEQLKMGNFTLPVSQQVGPLIGFGQNMVDKGDLQVFVYPEYLRGIHKSFTEISPSILYGISDKFSVFVELPIATKFIVDGYRSRGVRDLLVQLEYAVYDNDTQTTGDLITVVGNVTLPTGSAFKRPPTGSGAPSFFLGLTASRTTLDWYCFASSGLTVPVGNNGTKFGKTFLYQGGVGKNIAYRSEKWLLDGMIELFGIYEQQNKILGQFDDISGGHAIGLFPSVWFSTQRLIIQFGIGGFVWQHLLGIQGKNRYYIVADIGWKF